MSVKQYFVTKYNEIKEKHGRKFAMISALIVFFVVINVLS